MKMLRQVSCVYSVFGTGGQQFVVRNVSAQVVKRCNTTVATAQDVSDEWASARPFKDIPGPKPVPVLGNAWRFFPYIGDLGMDFAQMPGYFHKKFGTITKLGGLPGRKEMVFILDPADIEKVFRNEGPWPHRNSAETATYYRTVTRKEVFGGIQGALGSQGEEWQQFRSITNPVMMQPRATKAYVAPIDAVAQDFIKRIRLLRDEKQEMPSHFNNELHKWALESITYIALDTRLGCLENELKKDSEPQKLIDSVQILFESVYKMEIKPSLWKYISTPAWRDFVKACDFITDICLKYIEEAKERLKSLPEGSNRELTVLEKLLARDSNPKIAMVMAMDMMTAGIDTTSYSTAIALYHLARNPDKQEILYEEIKRHLPDKNQPITSDILNELKYLKACIKESMRMDPIAGGSSRVLTKDMVLSNYRIPKGTDVISITGYLCRMDKYFPQADKFLPERWLKTEGNQADIKMTNPFVYMPFGFGARTCLGRRFAELEMETLITKIVRNFKTEFHYGDMQYKTMLLLLPMSPLKFRFLDRE